MKPMNDVGLLHPSEPAAASLPADPKHVAIIMDGNGRWAAARGLTRAQGHRQGIEAVRRTVRAASEVGIRFLTLYSFSLENWSRPLEEVGDLMNLLRYFIREDLAELHNNNIRIRVIGERQGLDTDIHKLLLEAVDLTGGNDGLTLVIAFNYGSRQEIARAARRLAEQVVLGERNAAEITADVLEGELGTFGIPDPDLVIRTSGEKRLSNFLLWQAAYSEFVFMPVLWPDFDRKWLESALSEYRARERRFGGTPGIAAR